MVFTDIVGGYFSSAMPGVSITPENYLTSDSKDDTSSMWDAVLPKIRTRSNFKKVSFSSDIESISQNFENYSYVKDLLLEKWVGKYFLCTNSKLPSRNDVKPMIEKSKYNLDTSSSTEQKLDWFSTLIHTNEHNKESTISFPDKPTVQTPMERVEPTVIAYPDKNVEKNTDPLYSRKTIFFSNLQPRSATDNSNQATLNNNDNSNITEESEDKKNLGSTMFFKILILHVCLFNIC